MKCWKFQNRLLGLQPTCFFKKRIIHCFQQLLYIVHLLGQKVYIIKTSVFKREESFLLTNPLFLSQHKNCKIEK